MLLAALAAVMAGLDVLLGVIPRTAGVRHEDGENEAGDERAAEHADHTAAAEHKADDDGGDDGKQRGRDHFLQACAGAEVHAAGIVRIGVAFHDAGDLTELTAHLNDNALRSAADGVHRHGGEHEREASADEDADEHGRLHQREAIIAARSVKLFDKVCNESKRRQRGRADGKALAGRSSGVAERIERVGAITHLFGKACHLCNAARIVGHGAVGISGKGDAEGGEHTDRGEGNAVEAQLRVARIADRGAEVSDENGDADDDDGQRRGEHAEADAADDDGGRAGLAAGGEVLCRLVGVRGVIFRHAADQNARKESCQNGEPQPVECAAEQQAHHEEADDRHRDGGEVRAAAKRIEQILLVGVLLRLDEEGTDDGAQHADCRDDERNGDRVHAVDLRDLVERQHAQRAGGGNRTDVALIEVSAHAGHIADIVAHVIGDGGRVARVVLRDTGLDLTDKVRADIGCLGEDAAAHAGKECH